MNAATFVLFGATGDLAQRKIYPALFNLYIDRKLSPSFSVIGLGRTEWTESDFRSRVEQSIRTFSRRPAVNEAELNAFLDLFRYCRLNVAVPEDYEQLLELVRKREQQLSIPENRIFYLSVAPELFETIARNIQESGLGSVSGWKRLLIEKPFGRDLQSARALNEQLSSVFAEEEVFRIDHYLGKPMIQNLQMLEYTNPILQALWKNQYVANVQITASETVGVEERAAYYDKAGAIRDMFQNHMLQVLTMFAMQLPRHSTAEDVADKKRSVLASLRQFHKEEVIHHVIRGQYTSGYIDGKPVAGYTEEPGIGAASNNDTFIAARLWIDNYFWSEVPFYIRTGKRMAEKSTRIVIEFKDPLDKYSRTNEPTTPNLLIIDIGPNEGISFQLNVKDANNDLKTEPIRVHYAADQDDVPEAYENLIHNALVGDPTFFARWDEVELSWKWVQPILEAFEDKANNFVPLHLYEAGSDGPEASRGLLEEDGFHWWPALDSDAATVSHIVNKKGEECKYEPVR
ncbi:glucose-6-phosphate dehydrogenase [Paenibacillus profundus]|uniref:Glucose-6-phosphate 1-dehydrogenase n=1 Tax=Paenibacillus profundus TaxID=1173085 RepID=A0ABS8YI44_9BACL|nr:glucose-6-phosphate dehydrogenase [Paenibacillus profundus]MCE5170025.1 glucose-6-phosphate dehydrogenase [Paenibacillus profundus]